MRGGVSGATIGLDARKASDFGIGTYTRELIGALAANPDSTSYRFAVFVRPKDRGIFDSLPAHFSIEIADFPGYSLSELTTFAGQVRRRGVSLFHAFHYVLPPRLGAASIVTVHDLIHLDHELSPRRWAAPYARFMIGRAVSRARAVIAVSDATRRELEARFPVSRGKISVIPNGVSPRFRPDAVRASEVAKKHALPDRYALFLGGARPHKNLPRILEAFAHAGVRDPELSLVLAGPLPDPGASSSAPGRIRALGVVPEEDLVGLYSGALVFLYPTLAEGFGLPAIEAMSSGTPVIASAIPVWEETCGAAAILVDPRDPAAIADALVRLTTSAEERQRLRDLGLARAASFSWAAAAGKTLAAYRSVLSENR